MSQLSRPVVLWGVLNFQPHSPQLQVLLRVDQALQKQGPRFLDVSTGRQWGKTTAAEIALWMGLLQPDDAFGAPEVKVVADTYEHSNLIWDKFIYHLFGSPILQKLVQSYNKERELVTLKSGATCQKLSADNPERLTGFTSTLWIVDEAAFVQDRAIEHALPCIMVRQGTILAFGTTEGSGWHRTWSLRGQDPEYPLYWSAQYPSPTNPYFPTEDLDGYRQSYSDRRFRQLIMAEWQLEEGAVFHNIEGCVLEQAPLKTPPEEGHPYIMGVDLGRHHDYTVVYVGDPRTKRVLAEYRFNQIEWLAQAENIAAWAREYNKATIFCDASGVGDVMVEVLRDKGLEVVPYTISVGTKEPLMDALVVALEQEKIRFPRYPQLMRELQTYEAHTLPSGRIQTGAPQGYHDDCINALALLNWGFTRSFDSREMLGEEKFAWQQVR